MFTYFFTWFRLVLMSITCCERVIPSALRLGLLLHIGNYNKTSEKMAKSKGLMNINSSVVFNGNALNGNNLDKFCGLSVKMHKFQQSLPTTIFQAQPLRSTICTKRPTCHSNSNASDCLWCHS